jgi:hypothetical protein
MENHLRDHPKLLKDGLFYLTILSHVAGLMGSRLKLKNAIGCKLPLIDFDRVFEMFTAIEGHFVNDHNSENFLL